MLLHFIGDHLVDIPRSDWDVPLVVYLCIFEFGSNMAATSFDLIFYRISSKPTGKIPRNWPGVSSSCDNSRSFGFRIICTWLNSMLGAILLLGCFFNLYAFTKFQCEVNKTKK